MIQSLTLHSLSFLFSISSLTCTSLSFTSSFPTGWAQILVDQNELLTTFGKSELVNKAKLRRTCREEILLWEQELEEHLADKSSWIDQLQQNLSENEKNKELDKTRS